MKYVVSVTKYTEFSYVEVEADSEEEAEKLAIEKADEEHEVYFTSEVIEVKWEPEDDPYTKERICFECRQDYRGVEPPCDQCNVNEEDEE